MTRTPPRGWVKSLEARAKDTCAPAIFCSVKIGNLIFHERT